MKMSKAQYEKYIQILENDQFFCRRYQKTTTCGQRRNLIRNVITGASAVYYATDIEDGEQFRRYFDSKWELAVDTEGATKYDYLPDIWAEELQPKAKSPALTSTKEAIMTSKTAAIEITTKTFVNGADVANMNDSEIYALIASEELRIKELSAIQNKPKRLMAEIAKREAGIKALVDYLDSKE